ncbi:hypothetical protein E1B28_010594 [Marasmius oreades]|nr:uncharacterized protein E1B28_010594 [Marasmius oreades]KAG7091571.1 hypothetical protein E1B28_010594 [Marasmius oreades]
MCDILILREVSSETYRVSVKLNSTNPFRSDRVGGVVKIQKTTQSAEIVPGFGDRQFTVVSLEPEDNGDVEKIWTVLEPLYDVVLSRRRVWLPQLFGVGRSTIPTLIYHDEVVDAGTIIDQYEKTPIVLTYLNYRYWHSFFHVRDDETLRKLSIPHSSENWTFNLRTGSFQYDIITTALSGEGGSQRRYFDQLPPLPPDCNPLLDSKEIIRAVPDFLQLISSFRGRIKAAKLIRHDLVTFGTVVDRTTHRILAYFPSISPPVWCCRLPVGTPDVVGKYSTSVPSLVDLTFTRKNNIWKMKLLFSLTLPPEDCQRLRTAYLAQSFPFYDYNNHRDSNALACVDEFVVYLNAIFTSDPSTCDPPKYLHVPPLSTTWINDMPCIYWPLNNRLFYWSFDRSGEKEIPEEDWEKYGIPELKVDTYIGSNWLEPYYRAFREYLSLKDYDFQSGQQFADDHGYPILVKGNPHIRAENSLERGDLHAPGPMRKHPKSKLQRLATWVGKTVKRSSGKKAKGKGKAHGADSQVEAGRSGQSSIVDISDR